MKPVGGLKDYRLYVAFAVTALLMFIIYPAKDEFAYQYQKGRPWIYKTLVAPFDFPILKTQEQLHQEMDQKASEVVDYYNWDESAAGQSIIKLNNDNADGSLFSRQDSAATEIIKFLREELEEIYSRGIVSNLENDSSPVIFVKRGKRAREVASAELYTITEATEKIVSDLNFKFGSAMADSLASTLDLGRYIMPNVTYDAATTQLLHREAINYISPTSGMVYTGQLIVSEGEIVTAEIVQLLDSYKAEYLASYGYNKSKAASVTSHILLIIIMLAMLFTTIFFAEPDIFTDYHKYLFILTMAFVIFTLTVVGDRVSQSLLYLIPLSIYVLYAGSFFKDSFVLSSYMVVLIPLLVIADKGVEMYTIHAVAGCILLYTYHVFNRGWMQFLNAIFAFTGMMLVYLTFHLKGDLSFTYTHIVYMGLGAILAVMAFPFVFLLERIFSFVSQQRLWELSDTNNDLLLNLSVTAPGTFQHSLQVASLAEAAGRKIGADTRLLRVGALYHDIGKTTNPQCFIENQHKGIDYHAQLTPEQSAAAIINHVYDGVAIATRNHLPAPVIDFIASHHGRSMATFFYNSYCNAGGDPANTASFTYDGNLPSTKEQAILMIADSVEAASRSIKDYSHETVYTLVDNIVKGKIAAGQLADADISMKEISIVKDCLTDHITQIYHNRIAYPELKKSKK